MDFVRFNFEVKIGLRYESEEETDRGDSEHAQNQRGKDKEWIGVVIH